MGNIKKTIVCFGDSNTYGYIPETGGRFTIDERWTKLLGRFLGEDYIVIEEGLCGRTTVFKDPIQEGLDGISAIYSCIMSHKPIDLIIVMLGTNDVKQRFSATPQNISWGLESLIKKIKCLNEGFNGKPKILIITPPPIDQKYRKTNAYEDMGERCAEKSGQLAKQYEKVAERQECFYIDADLIQGVSMSACDFMHLGKEAHLCLAQKLSQWIPAHI